MKIDWPKRAEKAVHFLTETDRPLAELKVKNKRDATKAQRILDVIFDRLHVDDDGRPLSVEARKVKARLSPEYDTAVAAEMTSLLEYEKLRQERDTAVILIDFYRSWNKNVGGM